jgi:hypothetical protein
VFRAEDTKKFVVFNFKIEENREREWDVEGRLFIALNRDEWLRGERLVR